MNISNNILAPNDDNRGLETMCLEPLRLVFMFSFLVLFPFLKNNVNNYLAIYCASGHHYQPPPQHFSTQWQLQPERLEPC